MQKKFNLYVPYSIYIYCQKLIVSKRVPDLKSSFKSNGWPDQEECNKE